MAAKKDTSTYYDRVLDTLQTGFSTDEEKELFLNNVLQQLSEEVKEVCKDYSVSICLEELLQQCSDNHLAQLVTCLATSWSSLIQHRIASHIVQKLVIRLTHMLSDQTEVDLKAAEDSDSEEEKEELSEAETKEKVCRHFNKLCVFLKNNVKLCFDNQYCCHVLRTVLEVVGGVEKIHCVERQKVHKKKKGKKAKEVSEADVEIPLTIRNKLRTLYKSFTCSLIKKIYKQFKELTFISNHTNLLIQTALKIEFVLSEEVCSKHCRKIAVVLGLNDELKEGSLPAFVENSDQQFLFETVIQCSNDDLLAEIYTKLFKGRILKYALHKRGNYSLKALMNRIKSDQFLDLYEEIESDLEKIITSNPLFNIADLLASGCLEFRCNQARLVRQLLSALHCMNPEERKIMIVPVIIKWQNYEEFFNIKDSEDASERICIDEVPFDCISKTGSVLLQKLFKFKSNKLVVDSFLNLEVDNMCQLATSKLGGFVIQAFCESSNIGSKMKDALCDKFKGNLAKIACDQWGSRAIEDMYTSASDNLKWEMAEELSYFLRKLQNDIYGHFVCRKLALYHFSHRREDWKALQKNESRKRKLFKDILGGDLTAPSKNKKKVF